MLLKKKLKRRPRGRVKGSLIHPKLSVPSHVPGTVLADMRDTEMIQTCSPEGIKQGREGMNINTRRRYPGICSLPSHTFHSLILFPLGTTWALQTACPAADPYVLGTLAKPKRIKSRKGRGFPKHKPWVSKVYKRIKQFNTNLPKKPSHWCWILILLSSSEEHLRTYTWVLIFQPRWWQI